MRKTWKELNEIKKKYGVSEIFSWSRIHLWHTSKYIYYLSYVLRKKQTLSNVYAELGGACHETLEKYYSKKIGYDEMADTFDALWMSMYELGDSKFDRNDSEKDKKIASKYGDDLIHFFKNHKAIDGKVAIEQFVPIKFDDDILLQGYIDFLYKKDGIYYLSDWKTSTIYKGDKKEDELGQLVLYAIGLHQMGVPYENIIVQWNFMKYVNVTFTQANGKKKTREIERSKLVESLVSNVKMMLRRHGYNDSIDEYIEKMTTQNTLDVLPKEVLDEFDFDDCWVRTKVTEELVNKWTDYVVETVKDIRKNINEFNSSLDEKIFYDDDDTYKKNEYFITTLCGYPIDDIPPFKKYLAKKNGDILEMMNINKDDASNSEVTDEDWLNSLFS